MEKKHRTSHALISSRMLTLNESEANGAKFRNIDEHSGYEHSGLFFLVND
jgi:hypothetical protein